MREIKSTAITEAVKRMCISANRELPDDVRKCIVACHEKEDWKPAKETLEKLNPVIRFIEYPFRITEENSSSLIADYDIVVTALDNVSSRYLVNETCVTLKKPLVEAGVSGWEGLATTIIPGESTCYRCIFSSMPNENKGEIGLVGCLPGILGTIQAMEVIKLILGLGNTLANRLLVFDGLELAFSEFEMERDSNCPACKNL